MSEIEIDIRVNIFDDPEFCKRTGEGYCIHEEGGQCNVFDVLLYDDGYVYLKCDQCKTEYQKALKGKEKVENPCSKCGKEWDCVKTDYCSHCGNVVPF